MLADVVGSILQKSNWTLFLHSRNRSTAREYPKDYQFVTKAVNIASEETIAREFGAYDNIHDNFPQYVISLDEFDMSRNGIKHRNIRDFLLMEEWN